MPASDRDDALERLISATSHEAGDADADLRELAHLARTLRASGREHAREVNPAAGWLALSAAMDQTPQARPNRLFGWLRDAARHFEPRLAPFPAVASAGVILAFSLLLAMPQDSASAALMRDLDAIERAVAAASAHGSLTDADIVVLEQTASAVLDRIADDQALRTVPPAQAEVIATRLDEARRALSALPDTGSTPSVNALVSLSAASGLVESSLFGLDRGVSSVAPKAAAAQKSAPQPTVAPAAILPTATLTPAATVTSTPAARPPRNEDAPGTPTPSSSGAGAGGSDNRSREATAPNRPATATPSVATLLDTVSPVCAAVYDAGSLGGCRKAVEAAQLWCEQLTSEGARGCSTAVSTPLQAAERRVASLSDGCKQLPNSRSQQACRDSIEKSSNRLSRGSSGNTGKGDRGD